MSADFNMDAVIGSFNNLFTNVGTVSQGATEQANGIGQLFIIVFMIVILVGFAWYLLRRLSGSKA